MTIITKRPLICRYDYDMFVTLFFVSVRRLMVFVIEDLVLVVVLWQIQKLHELQARLITLIL